MKFECPTCSIHLQAGPETAGKAVKCPGCGTKIQIPDEVPSEELPPPSGLAGTEHVPSEGDAADDMVDDYYDDIAPLNVVARADKEHPSHVNVLLAAGMGAGATALWYLVMFMLPKQTIQVEGGDPIQKADTYLGALFLERGATQYVTTLFMFICLALLILKWFNIKQQRRAMLIETLPRDIDDEITIQNVSTFYDNLNAFPAKLQNTMIVNRIRKGLEFFYVRQNNPEVSEMLTSQSEVDANKVIGTYAIVKVFLWAIPIMGFIGTVIGIGDAIGGFGAVLGASGEGGGDMAAITGPLLDVLDSLGVAFDTTLLALVFSILLSFPASSLQATEEDLVTDIDEYCIDQLLKRLNDGGAKSQELQGDEAMVKALSDAVAKNQKDMLTKFAETQKNMAETQKGQSKYFGEVAAAVDKQLAGMEARTKAYESKLDEDFFGTLERIEKNSVDAMTKPVSSLAEGINNLNAVLKDLNGKQVVVKKKGLFG